MSVTERDTVEIDLELGRVGVAPHRNRADVLLAAQRLGGGDRRGLDRLHRGHTPVDHRPQLLGVLAVGDRGRVRPAGNPNTSRDRLRDRLPCAREHLCSLCLQLGRGVARLRGHQFVPDAGEPDRSRG